MGVHRVVASRCRQKFPSPLLGCWEFLDCWLPCRINSLEWKHLELSKGEGGGVNGMKRVLYRMSVGGSFNHDPFFLFFFSMWLIEYIKLLISSLVQTKSVFSWGGRGTVWVFIRICTQNGDHLPMSCWVVWGKEAMTWFFDVMERLLFFFFFFFFGTLLFF